MSNPFPREAGLVDLLMKRLGVAVAIPYINPNEIAGHETGIDVMAVTADQRIGIQVTELDTGRARGHARAAEKKLAQDARGDGLSTYGTWAQNNFSAVLAALSHAIERKTEISRRHDFDGIDEVWLLISCGIPELESVASTCIMTTRLDVADLSQVTSDMLMNSKYDRVFLHSILGVEKAVYQWTLQDGWEKDVQEEPTECRGPSFWDIMGKRR